MPTKQQLQQKINELEKEKEECFEAFCKAKWCNDEALDFIKALNLEDLFYKTMDTPGKFLNIEEAKEAINNVKCVYCENGCDCKNKN